MAHLYKRRNIYYFRMAVPRDLRSLVQQREIVKSLHTHYYDQARKLARQLLRRVELLFAAVRSGSMDQNQIKEAIAAFITSQEIMGAHDFLNYSGKLDLEYYNRFGHLAKFSPADMIPGHEYIRNAILSKMASYNTSGMEEAVKKVFGIEPGHEGYAPACFALLQFDADQYKAMIEMAQGDLTTHNAMRERYFGVPAPSATPSTYQMAPAVNIVMPATPPPALPTIFLSEAIERFTKRKKSEESWNSKSAYESEKNYDVIKFVVGDVEMSRFDDQGFVQEIVDRFKGLPKNKNKKKEFTNLNIHQVLAIPNTEKLSVDRINKYLEYLAAIVVFSIKGKWLTTNHFQDFKVKKKKGHKASEERDAYDKDEIARMLAGLQREFKRDEPEKLWIATLMLFHGCRPADLVRITEDQFKVIDDHLCMSVASKTDAGTRTFPVHPFVLACGFQRFLDTIPAGGKLWSDNLKFYEQKDADSHERWYNRTFEPKHVTAAPKKSLYSLRHSFITNLKHAEVNLFVVKSIVGHEKSIEDDEKGLPEEDITFDRYGKDYPTHRKLNALMKLDYGVDLMPFKQFCQAIQWQPIRQHPLSLVRPVAR